MKKPAYKRLSPAQLARFLELKYEISDTKAACPYCTEKTTCHKHRRTISKLRREASNIMGDKK